MRFVKHYLLFINLILTGMWHLILQVLASEVDFWNYTPTDLKTMEDEKMYPPRFEVLIDGRSAIGDSMLTVNFSGIKKKLMVKIPLRPTTGK